MLHTCKYCTYSTHRLELYFKHIETDKHKLQLILIKREDEIQQKELEQQQKELEQQQQRELEQQQRQEDNIQLMKVADNINKLDKTIKKEVKTVMNKVDNLSNKVDDVKKIANKNIKYSKSILAKLNEEYKDSPPLEYPGDRKSLTAIKDFYKISLEHALKTNKLQKAILKDFKNKILVTTIIKILTGFLKKDNIHSQSIFNTDTARNNYATKHVDSWKTDKAGEYLNSTVIKPFCIIIKTLMIQFVKYKYAQSDNRKKKLLNKDRTEDDIFLDKDEDEDEFVDLDDSSDEQRHFIEQLDEICLARELIKYIDQDKLYEEIIAKLAPQLNYNVRIKHKTNYF